MCDMFKARQQDGSEPSPLRCRVTASLHVQVWASRKTKTVHTPAFLSCSTERSLSRAPPSPSRSGSQQRNKCRSRRRGAVRMWRWRWTRSAAALPLSSVPFARRCRRRWTSRRCAWRWAGVPCQRRMWSDLLREAWLLCRRRLLRVLLPRCVRRVVTSMLRRFVPRRKIAMCVFASCILMRVLFVLPGP